MTASSTPRVITQVRELHAAVAVLKSQGNRVGLVPTMGALHEGHLSLVRAARADCHATVATIFVNPSQFSPDEDLAKYPRTLETDLASLGELGVRFVFVPDPGEIYPEGYDTWIEVGSVAAPLEGVCRPEHFRGVATIVLKLFNAAGADVAFFGQKDYQQVAVIAKMVDDLNVPIEVRVCPTVREPDGLAMSSRNAYLDSDARQRALVLIRSLRLADRRVKHGERDAATIVAAMRTEILTASDAEIDYIDLVDPVSLEPVAEILEPTVALLAVKIGGTRLIDNMILEP